MTSSWKKDPVVTTVSNILHHGSTPRLEHKEMLQFERMLETADLTTAQYFEDRKRRKRDAVTESESGEEDDTTSVNNALIKTIVATTGVATPEVLTTSHQAITWASQAILSAREATITATRRERHAHTLTPEQTVHAMSLISQLNSLLAGPSVGM